MPRVFETEIWKSGAGMSEDNILVVHFEFWMDDKFYVTKYTDLLNEVEGIAPGSLTRIKYRYDAPKSVTLDEKMFDIVCASGTGDVVCPYEGNAMSALDIAIPDETEDRSRYLIRKISQVLYVTLEKFAIPKCEQALVWNVFEYDYDGTVSSYSCDPEWETGDPGEDGLYPGVHALLHPDGP